MRKKIEKNNVSHHLEIIFDQKYASYEWTVRTKSHSGFEKKNIYTHVYHDNIYHTRGVRYHRYYIASELYCILLKGAWVN